jgi:hypothetical protein
MTKKHSERQQAWLEDKKYLKQQNLSFVGDTIHYLEHELAHVTHIRWPSDTYKRKPVEFFRDILGIDPWSRQIEVLEAIRDYPRVAVKSGHKVSKSNTIAGASLWWYSSYNDARVVQTSVTSRQVDAILWLELKKMKSRGGRCLACKLAMHKMAEYEGMQRAEIAYPRPCEHSALIDGEIGEMARTGLKSKDFREIVGFTAREAEAVAGISGANLIYFPDEASGISERIFQAMEGNRAGGARLAMFSNPTRNEGEFYKAFHEKKDLYHCITISSEETPNVVQGIENLIPGLANPAWIEEKKIEWGGPGSALYEVRVLGEFAQNEEGKAFSIHTIETSEALWHDMEEDLTSRLFIGLDPAGPTGSGDESALSARRGLKQLTKQEFRGQTDESHLVHLLAMIENYSKPREVPVVVFDREGKIGASLFGYLKDWLSRPQNRNRFELCAVRASDRAVRQPMIYDRVRDELASNLENWFRDGGAIITDPKLSAELHCFEWMTSVSGRLKITSKDDVRKLIQRSPDRFDALCLSAWEPLSVQAIGALGKPDSGTRGQSGVDDIVAPVMDSYAGLDAFRQR